MMIDFVVVSKFLIEFPNICFDKFSKIRFGVWIYFLEIFKNSFYPAFYDIEMHEIQFTDIFIWFSLETGIPRKGNLRK